MYSALFVGTNPITQGTVFACDKKGRYSGDDVSDDGDSTETEEEDNSSNKNEDSDFTEVHHFVICDVDDNTPWARAIYQSRQLRCFYCGQKDNDPDKPTLRIPVQCNFGDEHEYPPIRERIRKNLRLDIVLDNVDSCMVAMHVGCARWMDNDKDYQRIYFYPGESRPERLEDDDAEPDAMCYSYCDLHAACAKNSNQNKPKISAYHPPNHSRSITTPTFNTKQNKPVSHTTTNTTTLSDAMQKKQKTKNATTKTTAQKEKELAEAIVKDVMKRLREAENKKGAKETTITSEAKTYWKAKLVNSNTNSSKANLSIKEFKEIWSIVKVDVAKKLENPWKS